jgi:hypothetical protein
MSVEIIKDGIRPPGPHNRAWVFPVRLDGEKFVDWKVGNFDLNLWFKEAVGRYLRHDGGDQEEKQDILENWSRVEGKLREQVEKEAQLPFRMGVDGGQIYPDEWKQSREIPKEELPPLSDGQRATAKSLGISEEAYARTSVGQERTAKKLLVKVEMFGRLLARKLRDLGSNATVERVFWRTSEGKFDVSVRLN